MSVVVLCQILGFFKKSYALKKMYFREGKGERLKHQ